MTEKFNIQEKLPEFVKDAWTGALEAINKTEEEVRGFITKMVERGKLTPEEGKKIVNDLLEKFQENRKRIELKANESLEKALHRINLPTKGEVEKLSQKVTQLSRKVSKLKKEAAA